MSDVAKLVYSRYHTLMLNGAIDDYAKMADKGRPDLDAVFTMILCATNFLFGKL